MDLEQINPDNLIYKYKNEEISPKDFRNYQNPTVLFHGLRVVMICGNIYQKQVILAFTIDGKT